MGGKFLVGIQEGKKRKKKRGVALLHTKKRSIGHFVYRHMQERARKKALYTEQGKKVGS